MSDTGCEGLCKGKIHIFKNFRNEDKAFSRKISYYDSHKLTIQ